MRFTTLILTLVGCNGSGTLLVPSDEQDETTPLVIEPDGTTDDSDEPTDTASPKDTAEPTEPTCTEWAEEMTFDLETLGTVDTRVDEVTLSNGIKLVSKHGLWFEDGCFGIPVDGDIALCIRGSGSQPEDTYFDGGELTVHLPKGMVASWVTLKGCDIADDDLLVEAEDEDGNALHTEQTPLTGENACHTDVQVGWHSFDEKATVFTLSVNNTPGASEAWALNQLAIGNLCEDPDTGDTGL